MKALFGLGLVVLLFCAGCGEDSDPTRPLDFLPLTQITVESQYVQIANHTTNQFRALGHFAGVDFTRDISNQVTWSVSDPSILELDAITGLARGLSPGTVVITATHDGISGTIEFTVTDAVIALVSVEPVAPRLPIGLTLAFTAMGTFSDETVQDLTHLVEWTSSSPEIAAIDAAGVATALTLGSTGISADFQGVSGQSILTVTDAVLQSISLEPGTDMVLIPSETLQLTAMGIYSDGTTLDLTAQVVWSSSNTAAATVAQTTGVVTAVAAGDATISATLDGRTAELTVSVATLQSISVARAGGGAPIVPLNGTLQLIATGTFSQNLTRDITSEVEWTSFNANIATVSNQEGSRGVVSGHTRGSVRIRAELNDRIGELVVTVQ